MNTCIECGKPSTLSCGTCEQPYCATHAIEVRLYINGRPTATTADIHTHAGQPAHPETLKGVGGPYVRESDTWEWR
jgi:hypothetical protein